MMTMKMTNKPDRCSRSKLVLAAGQLRREAASIGVRSTPKLAGRSPAIHARPLAGRSQKQAVSLMVGTPALSGFLYRKEGQEIGRPLGERGQKQAVSLMVGTPALSGFLYRKENQPLDGFPYGQTTDIPVQLEREKGQRIGRPSDEPWPQASSQGLTHSPFHSRDALMERSLNLITHPTYREWCAVFAGCGAPSGSQQTVGAKHFWHKAVRGAHRPNQAVRTAFTSDAKRCASWQTVVT